MSSNIRIQRICEFCGESFEAKTTVTRFCSHRCNSRSYKLKGKVRMIEASDQETKMKMLKPINELKEKEFLSIDEACTLLGVSRMTLYRQLQKKKVNRIGRRVIITRATINQLLK